MAIMIDSVPPLKNAPMGSPFSVKLSILATILITSTSICLTHGWISKWRGFEKMKWLDRLATKSECSLFGYLDPDKYPFTACFYVAFPKSGTLDLRGSFLIEDRY